MAGFVFMVILRTKHNFALGSPWLFFPGFSLEFVLVKYKYRQGSTSTHTYVNI